MAEILYTNIPREIIMKDSSREEQFNFQDIEYKGIQMQVEPLGWNKFRVVRLYSTNPNDYLTSTIQPGSIISK